MRRCLPILLAALALLGLSNLSGQTTNPKQAEDDAQLLKAAKVGTDDAALLEYLRSRTLTDEDRAKVEVLIAQLGAMAFRTREQAAQTLIEKGPVVVELLKNHLEDPDPEISRRCEQCIKKIKDNDHAPEITGAVVRLLASRKAAGTVDALIAFLPFADNEAVADEARTALTALAVRDGKVEKALIAALKAKEPVRRAAAGEALVRAGVDEAKAAVQALLKDPSSSVRWRVASALVLAKHKDAVAVLIDTLPDINQVQGWQTEDILFRLAEGKSPPAVSLGVDEASRKKCREAWMGWWEANAKDIDLAVLHQTPKLLGCTTIIMLPLVGDHGRVLELDAHNNVLWKIENLEFPLDIQVLSGDKVLIAEYKGGKVTERDFKGKILWQRAFDGPQMAQRLPNGNTFIGGKFQLIEVDSTGKQVFFYNVQGPDGIMKCMKTPNGEIVCLFEDAKVVRMDATGKEISSFRIDDLGRRLFGGRIHALPNGRVLIPHHGENKVVEYDSNGKVVWQVKVERPIAATRLPNGNTIVTSGSLPDEEEVQSRAVEFDRNATVVWQFRNPTRVTRAIRR